MDFEQSLAYELQAITGLEGKVFPQQAQEDTKPPFVVYVSSEGEPIRSLAGATDMTELTCEVHVITETYEDLKSFTRMVLDRIESFFQRPIGREGVYIKSVSYTEPVEEMDNNLNYHRSSFDVRVRF